MPSSPQKLAAAVAVAAAAGAVSAVAAVAAVAVVVAADQGMGGGADVSEKGCYGGGAPYAVMRTAIDLGSSSSSFSSQARDQTAATTFASHATEAAKAKGTVTARHRGGGVYAFAFHHRPLRRRAWHLYAQQHAFGGHPAGSATGSPWFAVAATGVLCPHLLCHCRRRLRLGVVHEETRGIHALPCGRRASDICMHRLHRRAG